MTRYHFAALFFTALQALATQAFATLTPLVPEQHAPPGVLFPQPIEVRVTDTSGQPVQGATVRWRFFNTGITMVSFVPACTPDLGWNCSATTDAAGIARLGRIYGTQTGTWPLVVSSELGNATVNFVVDAAANPEISLVSGSGQRAVIGTPYAAPFVVRVMREGAPVANAVVYFLVVGPVQFYSSGPSVGRFADGADGVTVISDANGYAVSPAFTAGWGVGSGSVKVSVVPTSSTTPVSLGFTNTNAQGGTTLDFQDMWWVGPEEAGWGVAVHQQGDKLFSLLFAYDDSGRPTWRVMSDGYWSAGTGSSFSSQVHNAHGAPYTAYDTTQFTLDLVGSVSYDFAGEEKGHVGGGINVPWLQPGFGGFSKSLRRWDFSGNSTEPLRGVADIWWGGGSQAGWGVSIFERPGAIYAMWFTYDDAGRPTWYEMPIGQWTSANVFEGRMYSDTGSGWVTPNYDVSKFRTTDVGPFTLRFLGPNSAELDYSINGRTGMLSLQRYDFR